MLVLLLWVEVDPPERSVQVLTPGYLRMEPYLEIESLQTLYQVKRRLSWIRVGPRDWCPDEKGKLGQSPRGATLTEKVAEARWRQAWPWRGLCEPGSAGTARSWETRQGSLP